MAREDTKPTPGQDPDADDPELNPTALAPGDVAPLVDPRPRFYRDWRTGVTVAGILSLSAGAWISASPWALAYVAGDSRLNAIVAGTIVGYVSLLSGGIWRAEWLPAINVAGGVW